MRVCEGEGYILYMGGYMKGGHEGREGGDMMGANIKRENVKRNRFKGRNKLGRGYVKGGM